MVSYRKYASGMVVAFVAACLAAGPLLPVHAGPQFVWSKTYDGGLSDFAQAVATDSAGNVYVTGSSSSDGVEYMQTLKYRPDGSLDPAWGYNVRPLGNARAIKTDANGNVYLAGRIWNSSRGNYDFQTYKYNATGILQWGFTYDWYRNDEAVDLTVDAAGNIYVVGTSDYSSRPIIVLMKLTADGKLAGLCPPCSGTPNAVLLDATGNVFVTGTKDIYDIYARTSLVGQQYIVLKFAANDAYWRYTYTTTTFNNSTYCHAYGSTIDSAGNVYVTGSSLGAGTGYDCLTVKFDTNGYVKWSYSYNNYQTNANEIGSRIKVDGKGNVYVVGSTSENSGDMLTLKLTYDAYDNPTFRWAKTYNGPLSSSDQSCLIGLDACGYIYAAGPSYQTSTNGYDFVVLQYSADGTLQGTPGVFAGPTASPDTPNAMAIFSSVNIYSTDVRIYVAGRVVGSTTGYDYGLAAFSSGCFRLPTKY